MTCSPLIISPELQHTTDCHQTPIVQYNTRIKKLHPRTQPACLSVFLPSGLSAFFPAYLPDHLPIGYPACLAAFSPTCLISCLSLIVHVIWHFKSATSKINSPAVPILPVYLPLFLPVYLSVFLCSCLFVCLSLLVYLSSDQPDSNIQDT